MKLDRYQEALESLERVRSLAPHEACVHFQLGKVHSQLGSDRQALIHFNKAMDLNRDSKDYHTIKTHIERLHMRAEEMAREISDPSCDNDVLRL